MHLGKWSFFLLILFLIDLQLTECRRSGGGGSGSRGGSASRGSSDGFSGGGSSGGSSGTGRSGGFNNAGGSSGFGSGSRGGTNFNSGGGISSFSKGSGVGSVLRSNTFKGVIAGAAAGYLTYQAGKALINLASGPMMWNDRSYYWGSGYYQHRSGYEMCSMPLVNSTDTNFNDVFFSNGSRPKQIVWGCRAYTERCCGYECCPSNVAANGSGGSITGTIFIVLIVILVLLCCLFFVLYKFFRKTLDCILPPKNDDAKFEQYPMNTSAPVYNQAPPQNYPQQPQNYPQQPQYYPQQQQQQQQPFYPQQQAYPQQPYPAQPYPTQPY